MKIHNKAGFAALCGIFDRLTELYVIKVRNDIAAFSWFGTTCYLALEDIEGMADYQVVECLTYIANHEKAKINFEKDGEE